MYQPLGLECGHRFCADCAFTCVGKGRALGSVRAILDHVHPEAACPECRTPGQPPELQHISASWPLIFPGHHRLKVLLTGMGTVVHYTGDVFE